MQGYLPTRADAPAALLMALFFLAFGLFGFLRPHKLRTAMDNFADAWKEGSWHPYKLPISVLRYLVGGVGIAGASLFLYIAYVGFTR